MPHNGGFYDDTNDLPEVALNDAERYHIGMVLPPLPVLQPVPSYPVLHPELQLPSTWLQVSWVSSQLHCSWQLSPQVFPKQAVRTNTTPVYIHILASILTKYFNKFWIILMPLWWSNRHSLVTWAISNLWVTNAFFLLNPWCKLIWWSFLAKAEHHEKPL